MSDEVSPLTITSNGQVLPQVEDAEWWRIEQAYQEIQRRDERAEVRTWKAERKAATAWLLMLAMLGWNIWLWRDHRTVQAVVQAVQVDEQQRVVQLGIPQDVLAYQPQDALWMDMLGTWVRQVRWRDDEDRVVFQTWI